MSSSVVESLSKMNLLETSDKQKSIHDAPIVASYNDRIRPLLDAVDKLRHLKVMQEGIQLPTIVVVGDQFPASPVFSSPRGQGICTKVPLSMRLQNHANPTPELSVEFNGKTVHTDEANVADEIINSTQEIAGKGKGISNTPLTLIVKKKGVPDLTMVDLPGITRVPVHGQPENISEQISNIIKEYITPEESIILNVISAGVDFSTCESIRMSQQVDKTGQRTLAVVTKADKSPEGLLEKVTADDVNIGLGYVCVRNRIGDETYEEARTEESKLFQTNQLLSKIPKSIVGIPVLAERLMRIQATILVKCLPEIVRKISETLSSNLAELNKMPKHLSSIAEAMTAFMNSLGSARESLKKILLQGEFDEYPDDSDLHSTAIIADMLNKYAKELQSTKSGHDSNKDFLVDEMKVLEESISIGLPNFIPKSAFRAILAKKVKEISLTPFDYMENIWCYIEKVVIFVLLQHCDMYPQLIPCTRRAAQNIIARKQQISIDWIRNMVEMEKVTDYTCNPEYTASWTKLMSERVEFMKKIEEIIHASVAISKFGSVNIAHLRKLKAEVIEGDYDLKMRMTSYWDIVTVRMVDNVVLHLNFSIQNLINKEMEKEIVTELMGPQGNGLEKMLVEVPSVTEKRKKLHRSINLLKESKEVVANIIDSVATNLD